MPVPFSVVTDAPLVGEHWVLEYDYSYKNNGIYQHVCIYGENEADLRRNFDNVSVAGRAIHYRNVSLYKCIPLYILQEAYNREDVGVQIDL